jgi:tRNA (guanine-N7-)-methyltransferase
LVYREFLGKYFDVLKKTGRIEFKTDQVDLYNFALEEISAFKKFKLIKKIEDLHSTKEENIVTEFEEKFSKLGNKIYKIVLEK